MLVCLGRGGDLGLETGMETKSDLYGVGMDSGYSGGRRLGCGGWGRGEVEGEVEVQGRSTRSGIIPSLCILSLHLPEAHGPSHRLSHTPSFRDQQPFSAPSPGSVSTTTLPHCAVITGSYTCSHTL